MKSRVITIVSCEKNVQTPTTHTAATAIGKCISGRRSQKVGSVCCISLCSPAVRGTALCPGQWPCIWVARLMGTLFPWISLCSRSLPTFSQEQRPHWTGNAEPPVPCTQSCSATGMMQSSLPTYFRSLRQGGSAEFYYRHCRLPHDDSAGERGKC